MCVRLGRGLALLGFLVVGGLAPALAQGRLSGTLEAPDVRGYVIIACFADAELGCDEARSGYAEISATGARAAWTIDVAARGPYLLLAWRDANGDGEAQEHELVVLSDATGEPSLVFAPAEGLAIAVAGAAAVGPPPGGPTAAATPTATLHPDLVGIWQQTRAAAGDYRSLITGFTFSMTSGFSAQLRLRPDGSFDYTFYSSGVASDCAFSSHLERAVGTAALEAGSRLALRPTARRIEVNHCARSGVIESDLSPLLFDARIDESFDVHGHRGWTLALDGGPVPLALTLLHRPPSPNPPQPAQPADFVLGVDPPYREVVGLWSSQPHSDLGFFDPATDAWYLPEPNGAQHLWIRFPEGGGYELARAWPGYNLQGVCKKDYVYYERGQAQFAVTENVGGQNDHFVGHARFAAQDARLLVNVRACDQDDGATLHALTPQVSYYRWAWSAASTAGYYPEILQLSCDWQLSEWQFLVCDGSTYGRRE